MRQLYVRQAKKSKGRNTKERPGSQLKTDKQNKNLRKAKTVAANEEGAA